MGSFHIYFLDIVYKQTIIIELPLQFFNFF
jgi:hypothetical protein